MSVTAPASSEQRAPRIAEASRPRRGARHSGIPALLGFTLVMLLLVLGGALYYLRPAAPGHELSLDEVSRDAICAAPPGALPEAPSMGCGSGGVRVTEARFLDEDARITGTTVSGKGENAQSFWASYPKSDAATGELFRELVAGRAAVTVDAQSLKQVVRFIAQFLLPLVILANLFAFLFYFVQGSGAGGSEFLSFGRVGSKRRQERTANPTTFGDIAAAEEAVVELAEVRDYLADPSAFAAMGALPPKGVLLFGPPGCGKTLLARAVAGEARASFYSMSGSEFVEVLVGVGAARVRDLFSQARAAAPSIIFIDEIDAVGRQRGAGFGQGHDEREQTLNELLTQMDGFSPREGVVVMAATNRPDILDPALLRAGRFDRHVTLERPDLQGRLDILRLHAAGRRLHDPEGDLPVIARNTPGFTGADLANLLNESALLAVREQASVITRAHLEEAAERVLTGPKRRGMIISLEEKSKIAYHEGGHAVVATVVGKAGNLQKLSIIARGRGIGHLAVLQDDRTILGRGEMEMQIAIAMAGFAAEEIVFGEPSTGSEQDVERATSTARDMAGRYAMSSRLGPVRILQSNKEVFLGRDYLGARDVSQPTLEHLDSEVRRILEEQKKLAQSALVANRAVLDKLATELVRQETIQGEALHALLREVRVHPHLNYPVPTGVPDRLPRP